MSLREFYEQEGEHTTRYGAVEQGYWLERYHAKRFRYICQILQQAVPQGASFADIGCGEGEYLAHVGARASALYGCDLARSYLRRVRGKNIGAQLIAADATHLPFKDQSFDVVLCSEVIEHVPDLEAALRELLRVSRCRLIITTPNRGLRWKAGEALGVDVKKASEKVGHIHILNAREWRRRLAQVQGWKVETLSTRHILRPPESLETGRFLARLLAPLVSLAEGILDLLLPKEGDTVFLVCRRADQRDGAS